MNAKNAITNVIKDNKLEIDEAIDIDVFKEIKFAEPIQCEELNNEITMSIDLPNNIIETDTVELYLYHDGTVEKIDITINLGRITFKSDKFSMFAICRTERSKKDNPESNIKNKIL